LKRLKLGSSFLNYLSKNRQIFRKQINGRGCIDTQAKNKDKMMPLHLTAKIGNAELTQLLIHKGADVNAKGLVNKTPLHYAVEKGHLEIVQCLLANDANVNARMWR
jgi:ankyrin repeat protein